MSARIRRGLAEFFFILCLICLILVRLIDPEAGEEAVARIANELYYTERG